MTGDVRLVGLSELSATLVRARLLDQHDRFWDTDTRPLHHPVWFHQFGGFGAVAMADGGGDVGYVLGAGTDLSRDHAGPGADRVVVTRLLAPT